MRKFLVALAALAIPAAALAQPYPMPSATGYDPYAADAIARADYAIAEVRLMRRLDENSSDPSALLDLATVMTETHRGARASSLLEDVLVGDNVLLEGADGSALWSHDIAAAALANRTAVGLLE